MGREYQEIKIEKLDDKVIDSYRYTHPAFGLIGFHRITGGDQTLFGSSIEHHDRIMMTVKHAEEERGLHNDWFHGKGKIIEIEMSYSQFAECITAMNIGDGVPCTIRFTERDGHIPMISENVSKRKQFVDEFSENISKAMAQVQEQIDQIQKSIDEKKSLGVKDRREIISKLNSVKNNIGANLDFCAEQFNEQMDKTVAEAKGEIEAFCQNKINTIAQSALVENKDQLLKLENPIDMPNEI